MNDFLDRVIFYNTIEEYLWFFGIILFVLIFSSQISRLIGHLIYRIFRRLTEDSKAKEFVILIQRPLSFLLILLTIFFAFNILEYPQAFDFSFYGITVHKLVYYLYRIIFVIALTWLLLRIVNYISMVLLAKAELTESKADDQIIHFMRDFLQIVFVIIAILFILGAVLQFNITSLLAGAGIAGIAIALAAKEPLENLFGSFTIFIEKPFTIGDFIQVGEVVGTVEKVGFRSTRIRTLEKTFVTLPNRKIMDSYSENLTLRTFRRVRMNVGVTYDTSIEKIQRIVAEIQQFIDEHELTNQDGIIGFHDFGESSLNILVQYYIQNMEFNTYVKTREEINFKIMEIVKKHESQFAFPTTTVHLFKEN